MLRAAFLLILPLPLGGDLSDLWSLGDHLMERNCRKAGVELMEESCNLTSSPVQRWSSRSSRRACGEPMEEICGGELVVVQGRGTVCPPAFPPSFQDIGHCSANFSRNALGTCSRVRKVADAAVPCYQGVHISPTISRGGWLVDCWPWYLSLDPGTQQDLVTSLLV